MSEDAGGHSVAGPSRLHQIDQCPGSIVMQKPFPEDPTSDASMAAADGTAAHWAMAEQMDGRITMIGDRAANGVFLTAEMVEAADLIVQDVETIAPRHACVTEVAVDIHRIHPQCWGTPDVRVWAPKTHARHRLFVWDLKFGFRYVSVFENLQLLAYAFGAIDQARLDPSTVEVTARIVQPRCYGNGRAIREWTFVASDALPIIERLRDRVAEALGPKPRTIVGPACRNCRARHACETYQHSGEDAMDLAGSAMPHELPAFALGVELRNVTRMLEFLEGRKESLEQQAISLINAGTRVPHFALERGTGKKVWTKPAAQILAAGELIGLNLSQPADAITPTQALAKGFPSELAETFIQRAPGSVKLKLNDGSEARRIFGLTTP